MSIVPLIVVVLAILIGTCLVTLIPETPKPLNPKPHSNPDSHDSKPYTLNP